MKLSRYLILSALFGHILVSLFIIVSLFFLVESLFRDNKRLEARETAELAFSSMYQIMKRGWSKSDIEEFLSSLEKGHKLELYVYRGKTVEELYGEIKQKEMDAFIQDTFFRGADQIQEGKGFLRYTMPLIAKQECLSCHINAKEGDVLGVMEVKTNFEEELKSARYTIASLLVMFGVLPLGGMFLLGSYLSRKMTRVVEDLDNSIKEVDKLGDLKEVEKVLKDESSGIREFDELRDSIHQLLQTLKSIAVDREVLEFEIKILEKFILTADFLKDWKYYICAVLKEFNRIVPTVCMFTLFRTNNEGLEVVIFWLGEPGENHKRHLEDYIQEEAKRHFGIESLNFEHKICAGIEIIHDPKDMRIKTKSLVLEKPGISGICGVGFALEEMNITFSLAIESTLTAIINTIGSAKAIDKYTKDIQFYANRDPLTGLFNRTMLIDFLILEIDRAKKEKSTFGIIMLDADNLGAINDTYGNTVGDQLLKFYADLIKEELGEGAFLARYEGDSFVAVLSGASEEDTLQTAKGLVQMLKEKHFVLEEGETLSMSFSVGISIYPSHGEDYNNLLLIAENMVREAKKRGKGYVVVPSSEDVSRMIADISSIGFMLIRAVEKKSIIPYYQPIVNLKTGKVEAHEVLMRIEKDGEILPAGKFVEVAESMGLINKMDLILFEKVMEKIKTSDYGGLIFLNISPKILLFPEFPSEVKRMVTEYRIDPSRIVFELTERETIKNLKLAEDFLKWLLVEGFRLALDDFGSGFSSYSYIKLFPCEFVKIEGELIQGMSAGSEADRAIVRSIASLCKELGIKTIAEFVENEGSFVELRDIGVDYAQGYYIGKPSSDFFKPKA